MKQTILCSLFHSEIILSPHTVSVDFFSGLDFSASFFKYQSITFWLFTSWTLSLSKSPRSLYSLQSTEGNSRKQFILISQAPLSGSGNDNLDVTFSPQTAPGIQATHLDYTPHFQKAEFQLNQFKQIFKLWYQLFSSCLSLFAAL